MFVRITKIARLSLFSLLTRASREKTFLDDDKRKQADLSHGNYKLDQVGAGPTCTIHTYYFIRM